MGGNISSGEGMTFGLLERPNVWHAVSRESAVKCPEDCREKVGSGDRTQAIPSIGIASSLTAGIDVIA
jgi:hypothetical protein